jgi:hypothetical protein
LRLEAEGVYTALVNLGPQRLTEIDRSLFKPIALL